MSIKSRRIANGGKDRRGEPASETDGQRMARIRDCSSREGAAALAAQVQRYWAARGVTVVARVEVCGDGQDVRNRYVYGVRSDLKLTAIPAKVR